VADVHLRRQRASKLTENFNIKSDPFAGISNASYPNRITEVNFEAETTLHLISRVIEMVHQDVSISMNELNPIKSESFAGF